VIHNLQLREREIDIEKLLGADASLIRALLTGEYTAIALLAWVVGAAAAIGIAWGVTHYLLDIKLSLSWLSLLFSLFVTVGVTAVIAAFSSDRILRMRGASAKL
jgi:ABC-type antimicrobial peptide transport system permease subunit